jgi:hypothetical protein
MSELLLLVHVLAVVVWLGAGLMGQVLAAMADARGDVRTFSGVVGLIGDLTLRLFVPASLLAFASGVALVASTPWGFGEPWVLIGLAGFAATFGLGALVIGPRAGRLAATLAADGGALGVAGQAQARALLAVARAELVVLVVVVAAMVLKP